MTTKKKSMKKTLKKKTKKLNRADFGIRFGAHILDNIMQVFAAFIVVMIFMIPLSFIAGASEDTLFALLILIGVPSLIIISVLNQIVLVKKTGQSLGKRIVGTKIIRDKGKLTWGPVIIRHVVKSALLFFGILGALAYSIPIMATKEKKSIGDYAAETSVIKLE